MNPMLEYQQTGEGFEAVYREYHRLVYWRLRGLLRTRNDATLDELTQEVFLRAVRYRQRYDAKFKPSTWLAAIAKGGVRDWLRRQSRRPVERKLRANLSFPAAPAREVEDLGRYVARLHESERHVVTALIYDGLTWREAEERLSISSGTIFQRWERALGRLRKMIETP